MEKLKTLIYAMDSEAKKRILNTIIIDINKIPENEDITNKFNNVLKDYRVGGQYEWLGRYADSIGINNLELCIHLDDAAQKVVVNEAVEIREGNDSYFKIKNKPSNEYFNLFSYFHFPILALSKTDMEKNAKESGFEHIMEATWFCHSPIKGQPCGICPPCRMTRDEGLGRRVPNPTIYNKIIYYSRKGKNKVKRLISR